MSAAAALARAEAAGVWLGLDAAGVVQMRAGTAPPLAVVADLRQHREAVAAILAVRARIAFYLAAMAAAADALAGPEIGPELRVGEVDHDDAERAALAAFYAAPDNGLQP